MDKNISKGLRDDIEFLKQFFGNQSIVEMHEKRIAIGSDWGEDFAYINKLSITELKHVLKEFFPEDVQNEEALMQLKEEINKQSQKSEGRKPKTKTVSVYTKEQRDEVSRKIFRMDGSDKVDSLQYDDYTELIAFAEFIKDEIWRNELLEREAGLNGK